jgi:leucyl aminopeptidase
MKIKTVQEKDYKTAIMIIGIFKNEKLPQDIEHLDVSLNSEISRMIKAKEWEADLLDFRVIPTQEKLIYKNLLVMGLGEKKDFSSNKLRKAAAKSIRAVESLGVKESSTTLHKLLENGASVVSEGALLGSYKFKKYVTVDKDKIKMLDELYLVDESPSKDIKPEIKKAEIICNNVNFIRDLVNEQAAVCTPEYLADQAKHQDKLENLSVKVYGKEDIVKMKMGGLLGVSKGSALPPRFIVMEYKGSSEKPIVFVGKGITFDSGGLDVKPWKYMLDMKCDMAGAATVIATLKTAAELKLKRHVVGIIPTCENFIGPESMRQGDILTAYNGKNIEVWHTDAEGRLILADGLSYAEKEFDAAAIIDIATLTGASIIALGYEISALISTDDKLKKKLLDAAKNVDEYTWELPIVEEYKDLVKGSIGDVMNMSKEDVGPGTITAAIFLSNFVEKTPWAHFDIGASGWMNKDTEYKRKGGTGVCLRTFVNLLENWGD